MTGKTIIYQSYRTTNVAAWIDACMRSVRSWAARNDYEYRFIDDRFFDYAPTWFREKARNEICPVADLARLEVAKQLLAEGYQRAVWVDADMLVFDPEKLRVDTIDEFAFCHEAWLYPDPNGGMRCDHRINNSISIFNRGSRFLDPYIEACLRLARERSHLGKIECSTVLLTKHYAAHPFAVLPNVGMLSPHLMSDIATDQAVHLKHYAANLLAPIVCANLCASLVDAHSEGDEAYERVVDACLKTRGDVVNRHFTVPLAAPFVRARFQP